MNSFRSFRAAVFAGALAVVWTNPVISEESDTDADIEEVIVTGSRIARSNTETTAPIKILDRFEIEKLGQTSIGDFLQDLPENVGGLNAQNNNGGNGSTQISLRGLGSSRTLVLVNGRRHVGYSTGGSVDLNAIAPNTIERIEVFAGGRLDMPTRRLEALRDVFAERQTGRAVDRDLVVVVQVDEVAEAEMTGERRRFVRDAFHQVAIGDDAVNDVAARARGVVAAEL